MTMLKNGTINNGAKGGGSYWNTSAFRRALQSKPDVITIMLGTNDAKEENWFGVQQSGDSFVSDYKVRVPHMFATMKKFGGLSSMPLTSLDSMAMSLGLCDSSYHTVMTHRVIRS